MPELLGEKMNNSEGSSAVPMWFVLWLAWVAVGVLTPGWVIRACITDYLVAWHFQGRIDPEMKAYIYSALEFGCRAVFCGMSIVYLLMHAIVRTPQSEE